MHMLAHYVIIVNTKTDFSEIIVDIVCMLWYSLGKEVIL